MPCSRIVATRADMSTDPSKTGLVRCLVSKSHGSEVCNCRVQRDFFFSLGRITIAASPLISLRKKKPSGTQGKADDNNNNNNFIIITLFESQIILAEHECCTNWGDCKSNKSNQIKR